MSRPSWDVSELALSALSDMGEADRVNLMLTMLTNVRDLSLISEARNALTEHLNDLIANRYADHLLEEFAA